MNISVQKAPVFVSLAVAGMLALSGCVSVNSSGSSSDSSSSSPASSSASASAGANVSVGPDGNVKISGSDGNGNSADVNVGKGGDVPQHPRGRRSKLILRPAPQAPMVKLESLLPLVAPRVALPRLSWISLMTGHGHR